MNRERRRGSGRRARAYATLAAVLVHVLAGLTLVAYRTPPAPRTERALSVELVRPERLRPRTEPELVPPTPEQTARPSLARPRAAAPKPSVASPDALPLSGAEGATGPAGAVGRTLSALFVCDPERLDALSEDRRAACLKRLAQARRVAAPLQATGARRWERMYEQAGIMGEVRRAENGGERASCAARRNLDSSCPNLLPDNLPKDFKLPRD